ncbi:hypothetical protein KSP39_PZI020080 [Platanthera zijinensis]|uniref:Uncharacterized protein n=1 Tax=Platanthera zijinensis TaxID=2320716 RepID=A0AAP0B141_9ASPA
MENRQSEQSQNLSRWEDEMLKLRLAIQQSTEQTTQEMRLLLQDMRFLLKASTSGNHFHNFQGEVRSIPLATRESYYDKPGQMHYGQQIGPGHSSTAPWAAHWGAHPAPSPYGAAVAPSPYGAAVAPSSYGAAFAPSPFGAAVAPSSYGAAFAPSPFGAAVAPSSYGAAFAPSPFGAAVAPSSYGAAFAPSPFGAAVAPSSYGAAVTPSSYGTAVPSARAANVAPSACIATIAPNLCGATAALPNATLLPNPSTSIGDAHSKRIIEDKHEIIDDIDTQQWTRVPVIICIEEEQQGVIQANNLLDASIAAHLVSSPMEVLSFAPVVLDISDNTVLPPLKELMQHHHNSNVITGSPAHVTQVGRPHDNTSVRSHVSTWTIHVFDPGGCGVSIHSTYVEPQINKFQDAGLALIYIQRVIWVFDPGGIKRRGRRLNGEGRNVTTI